MRRSSVVEVRGKNANFKNIPALHGVEQQLVSTPKAWSGDEKSIEALIN